MRKITREVVGAFNNRQAKRLGNTVSTGDSLWLHGNCIARYTARGLEITNARWQSVTTKERLNGINGVSINQKAGVWYLNGVQWDGQWIVINN